MAPTAENNVHGEGRAYVRTTLSKDSTKDLRGPIFCTPMRTFADANGHGEARNDDGADQFHCIE
jgi:hypothetical protein